MRLQDEGSWHWSYSSPSEQSGNYMNHRPLTFKQLIIPPIYFIGVFPRVLTTRSDWLPAWHRPDLLLMQMHMLPARYELNVYIPCCSLYEFRASKDWAFNSECMFNQRNGVKCCSYENCTPHTLAPPSSCSSSSTPPKHLVAKKSKDERDVGMCFQRNWVLVYTWIIRILKFPRLVPLRLRKWTFYFARARKTHYSSQLKSTYHLHYFKLDALQADTSRSA